MKTCLYCHTNHQDNAESCQQCGMPLPSSKPQQQRIQRFVLAFIAIALFCAVMIVYLPR